MNTERTELPITIRPAERSELDLYEAHFSPNNRARYHQRRFAVQEREAGVYLIAWYEDEPVGHFLLRWDGPADDTSGRYPPRTPYLEAGATKPLYQRRGVGTRMIQEAERLARERDYDQIGLAVGSADNPLAKKLYERMGYQDWGKGEFEVSWDYESDRAYAFSITGIPSKASAACAFPL